MIFLEKAMEIAERGRGFVSTNPVVGAVLVRNGKIIARDWHRKIGEFHAERNLLEKFKGKIFPSDTLVVTLEPCCHRRKRTEPCTDIILKKGIKKIVVGLLDPNPEVSGRGLNLLRKSDIETKLLDDLDLQEKLRWQNRFYFSWMRRKRPWVTLKIAQSLDGRITPKKGTRYLLTGKEATDHALHIRADYDAILIGVKTVIVDNPRLTARDSRGNLLANQPRPVILDDALMTPLKSELIRPGTFIFIGKELEKRKNNKEQFQNKGVEIYEVKSEQGHLDLHEVLHVLAQKDITSLLIEGGPSTWTSFLREDLADELMIYFAAKFLGEGVNSFEGLDSITKKITFRDLKMLGEDLFWNGVFSDRL